MRWGGDSSETFNSDYRAASLTGGGGDCVQKIRKQPKQHVLVRESGEGRKKRGGKGHGTCFFRVAL